MGSSGVIWGKMLNLYIMTYKTYKNIVYNIHNIIVRIRSVKSKFFLKKR